MHRIRYGAPKDETYNKYGDADRKVDIDSLEEHGNFARYDISEIPDGCAEFDGAFSYTLINTGNFTPRSPSKNAERR